MKTRHMSFGQRAGVLMEVAELEAKGYTRAESEAALGPREYYLADDFIRKPGPPGRHPNDDASARMVLIWESED